ncbi:hypothetical protein N2152v2_006616 [Parachlorella kessleri]
MTGRKREAERPREIIVLPLLNDLTINFIFYEQGNASHAEPAGRSSRLRAKGSDDSPQRAEEAPTPPGQPTTDQPASPGQQEPPMLQLPREVVQRLRDSVFGFEFFVTGVENYQANGVLFRGNLRGDPAAAYAKLAARLKAELGDDYRLYLLEDTEEKPVAVVLPLSAVQPVPPPVNEALLAGVFGAATVAASINVLGGDVVNFLLLTFDYDLQRVIDALPATVALLAILGAHEVGHIVAAKQRGVQLAPPILIPAGLGLLGSFGSITRIKSIVPDREALGAVAAAGPLAGSLVALVILGVGLGLTVAGVDGIEVDSQSFSDSLLVGLLGQFAFGGKLYQAEALNANPLFIAGWSGLIVQALNMIPIGELDGGRTLLALFGRRAARSVSTLSFLALGVFAFANSLALYWFLLTLTLQRGPPAPCENELAGVQDGRTRAAALAMLALPLLVLLPYPFGGGGEPGLPDLGL